MENEKRIAFDPFCLDLANECLWRGAEPIRLRPKAFAVLCYLLGRRHQLVTKEELMKAVWPETFVSEAVLKVAVRQIREALEDDSAAPRFIETAHRRGYRFIGQISDSGQVPAVRAADIPQGVVGRDEVLQRLQSWLERMLSGERQIVFVTGEAGTGKTALVDTFAQSLASNRSIRIGRGQCLEQYGTGEAYLPVLEAISRLGREEKHVIDVLRKHAPMWLLQMPSLVSLQDREVLRREVFGATRERMLREIGGALEVLTADGPLLLILEDLHWSDYSTLDLISYLATQRQAKQLMVIGTYRAVELIVSGHPLQAVKRELAAKQLCEELPLQYLSKEAVATYLSVRFPVNRFPDGLAGMIYERTEGNPLFMVNAVDYLFAEGLIAENQQTWELTVPIQKIEVGVPDSIRQMIERQIDHLDDDQQRTLEAASVAGAEFSTIAVAAGLREDRAPIEARCDALARQRRLIKGSGVQSLPNGEAVSGYGFIHALYRNVLYERVPLSRRVQLHRRIGEQWETLYGNQAGEIAAELAMHFERGVNYHAAVKYLQLAADNDIRRFAYREAVALSRRGLELLGRLPDTRERARLELRLQLTLGVPLIATEGYPASEVGAVYLRARALCRQLGEAPEITQVLWGLWTFYLLRSELNTAREVAEEFLRVADSFAYPELAVRGYVALGVTLLYQGNLTLGKENFDKARSLYDPEGHRDELFRYTQNPGVASRCHGAWTLWFLGKPDQALDLMREALTMARELSEPHGLAHAHYLAAALHQFRGEGRLAQEQAEVAISVSGENGLLLYRAVATVLYGWALCAQGRLEEGIDQMRQGIAAHEAIAGVSRPHFLALLAEGLYKASQPEEGLRVLEAALAVPDHNGEAYYHAELFRLKGELLLVQPARKAVSRSAATGKAATEPVPPAVGNAEACFRLSLKIARQQKSKSLELRAAMSMARLYPDHAKQHEARELLAQIHDEFTEGFDTADLLQAKALLDELSPSS